ncbi:MAG: hypothetical protein OHK0046_10390 [Anaerolineae bacterium]
MQMNALFSRKTLMVMSACLLLLTLSQPLVAQHEHGGDGERPEITRESPIPLNPALGSEVGFVYEAFLSPHQEGGEEEDTPRLIPPQFRSTAPSVPRSERTSHGHAVIEFTNDLSRAYVHLAIENVNVDDIVMLHLHCGRPGQLGPIIIDFATFGNLHSYLEDGVLSVEVMNEDIEAVTDAIQTPVDGFTSGCPIVPSIPNDKVKTIAGMELIARQGELYFNLHTAGQTYFGDIRGQFHLVENIGG